MLQKGHVPQQGEPGYGRVVVEQGVEAAYKKGDGTADPHGALPEEAVDQAVALFALDYGQAHLGDGVGQALALHPLAPRDDGDGRHGRVQGQEKKAPPDKRLDPGLVGDGGCVALQALEKSAVFPTVVDHDAVAGKVGKDLLGPFVLRRGVVIGGGDDGQQLLAHAHGAQGRDDEQHEVDQDEVGTPQRQGRAAQGQGEVEQGAGGQKTGENPARSFEVEVGPISQVRHQSGTGQDRGDHRCAASQLEQNIQQADEHEEDENGPWGVEVPGHKGGAHGGIGVRDSGSQHKAEEGAGPKAAPR